MESLVYFTRNLIYCACQIARPIFQEPATSFNQKPREYFVRRKANTVIRCRTDAKEVFG